MDSGGSKKLHTMASWSLFLPFTIFYADGGEFHNFARWLQVINKNNRYWARGGRTITQSLWPSVLPFEKNGRFCLRW